MQKGDNNLINVTNRVNVLNILWQQPSVYRAEIARCTNLSIPTVMKIIDDLTVRGLVRETGKGVSSGGKPPLMLEVNKSAYYMIGVDINEHWTEVVLVNLLLGIEEKRIQDIRVTDTVDSVIQRVIREIHAILEHHPDKADRILGIGVGIPGLIDPKRGFLSYSAEMNWRNVNVKELFANHFDGEIIIEERTRAMASGEMRIGRAQNIKNFMYVNISSGIGSAMVMNGKLYYGNNKSSGRLGHMAVEKDGLPCNCGNHGCLELYASGNAIARIAKQKVVSDHNSLLYNLVYGDIDKIDVYIVFEAAKNHDKMALGILKDAAEYLGMAVSGVINLMDPKLIIFGGKVSRIGDVYMDMFKQALTERYAKHIDNEIEIICAKGSSNMASIGAATFILDRFLATGGEVGQLVAMQEIEGYL